MTTNGLGGTVTNLELKSFDHTSNMFLAFAAIISCGMDGIRRSLNLPKPVQCDPAMLSDEEKQIYGIKNIPKDFEQKSKYILGTDERSPSTGKPIRDLFGMGLIENYNALYKEEYALFG